MLTMTFHGPTKNLKYILIETNVLAIAPGAIGSVDSLELPHE